MIARFPSDAVATRPAVIACRLIAPTSLAGGCAGPIELPELTGWAIDGRYPADLDEATQTDDVKAIVVARQVLDLVRPRITPYA